MRLFGWVVAGAGVVAAVYALRNRQYLQSANGDMQDAADRTSRWGTKQSLTGMGGVVAGKLKEGFGKVTGDKQIEGEGVADQAVGGLKDLAGNAAHAVSDLSR